MEKLVEKILRDDRILKLKGSTAKQIQDAENSLGLSFSDEYKKYTETFGAISLADHELTGVVDAHSLNVVDITEHARKMNNRIPGNMYVIENMGIDGNKVLQNEKGEVFAIGDAIELTKIANSIEEYLFK